MIIIDAFIHRSIRHWASRPRGRNEGCLLLPKFDFGASRRSYYLITSARRARSAGIRACGGRRLLNVPCFRVLGRPKSQTPNAVILHPSSEKELALSSPRLWKRRSTCSKNQHGTSRSVKIGVHSPFGVSRRRSRPWRGCPDLRPD